MGDGMATIRLRRFPTGGLSLSPAWDFESARYDFSPTPEPAAFLLTATGLLELVRRRRRARKQR